MTRRECSPTKQEPKETLSAFVTRWRNEMNKAAQMINSTGLTKLSRNGFRPRIS